MNKNENIFGGILLLNELDINVGFTELNLHSIEANVNPENEKSERLLVKFGFKKEAYFRENFFYNGIFKDSIIYSILETYLNFN